MLIPLDKALGVKRFGGKANALAAMCEADLPIPPGFVVPVDVYHEQLKGSELLIKQQTPDIPFDKTLADDFHMAWKQYIGNTRAAVRSSATVEDATEHSFAGQFHTELGVTSANDGLKAVRTCWESIHSDQAKAYIQQQTAHDSKTQDGMCVIVQQMVDVAFAGVIFTREPLTKTQNILYAEWVNEIGETLVSGQQVDGRCWLDQDGKVLRADYLHPVAPPEDLWQQLYGITKQIVTLFGAEQDIEWAYSNQGKLFVLQARPITTSLPLDFTSPPSWILPGVPLGGWSKTQKHFFGLWDEYYPRVVTPLDYDLFGRDICHANLRMLDVGDGFPDSEQAVVCFHAVPIAINPAAPMVRQAKETTALTLRSLLPAWREKSKALQTSANQLQHTNNIQLLEMIDASARHYAQISSIRLLQMYEWIDGEQDCTKQLKQLLGDAWKKEVAADLCSGVDHENARMNQRLRAITLQAAEDQNNENAWLVELEEFLNQYGHIEVDGKLARYAKEAIIASIRQSAVNGIEEDPVSIARRRAQQRQTKLRQQLPESRKKRFDKLVAQLRQWITLRENSKTEINRPLLALRDAISEVTHRLQISGTISPNATADLFTRQELRDVLQGNLDNMPNLQIRAVLLQWKLGRSWLPAGFSGQACDPSANSFQGLGASLGIASGPARLISSIEEFGLVQSGDILVTRNTSPAWTILFDRVAAVVVENGSRISHAAIVAREYNLPAVVDLPGICHALQSGEKIQVDGGTGEIQRIN